MIAPTAVVEGRVGPGTKVWHHAVVRGTVGRNCVIGSGAHIDVGVSIGDCCKVENGAQVFGPTTVEPGVFIGPGAMILNDRNPRALGGDGSLAGRDSWEARGAILLARCSIGAGAIIMSGVMIGSDAMVGAGAVVLHDVPDGATVVGNPARRV